LANKQGGEKRRPHETQEIRRQSEFPGRFHYS